MATINYLYRSTKPEAFLNIRLLFRHDDEDFQIGGKTKIQISKDYWKNTHERKRINDPDLSNYQLEVKSKLNELSNYILDHFNKANPENVDKEWLKNTLKEYYNPKEESPETPQELISFIDFYLERKQHDLSDSRKRRIKVIQNKLVGFQKSRNETLLIKKIDENFKKHFTEYCTALNYSKNTQQNELTVIKTVCFYARKIGLETSLELQDLRLKGESVNHIYLNSDELESIKSKVFNSDYLVNARDWLLISCYTGQRVSDFMRFNPEMIRNENDKYFLEFKQQKTKKLMTIPLIKEARLILEKRNGNFPRATSHQKYNEYIKEVCKLTGINNPTKGKKIECIAEDGTTPTKNDYRKKIGTFEKWELVSSHVGRRSFATNYYGKVPTTYLIGITGHSTEKQFLNYIKKSNKDLALDAYDYFN